MKYTIYEDSVTHKFAFLPLPNRFVEGDEVPIVVPDRWFDSHAEALAALPELLNLQETEPEPRRDDGAPLVDVVMPIDPRRRH